ncbi:DUF4190 domain-containing protein [Agromyces sp. NPDC058064]|uniref:DUF4190 domain-containing protein n=1 Tax=Agromyces sp. NPDC058064 TaxID=3346322 RepID=UPI0036DE66D2
MDSHRADLAPPPPVMYDGYGNVVSPATPRYVAPPHNVLAWVSLGLAISWVLFGLLTSVAAIVCGHIARGQIRRTGEQGAVTAMTGLVLGYVLTAFTVCGITVFLLFVFGMSALATSS